MTVQSAHFQGIRPFTSAGAKPLLKNRPTWSEFIFKMLVGKGQKNTGVLSTINEQSVSSEKMVLIAPESL